MRSQREHLGDNVAYGDHTKPTSVEVWLADRVPGYRYGVVLALLAITYIVMAAAPPDPWTRVLTVFLQGATLLAAFVVSRGELAALSYCRGRRRPRASDRDWVGGCQLVDSADQRLLPPEHPPGRERAVVIARCSARQMVDVTRCSALFASTCCSGRCSRPLRGDQRLWELAVLRADDPNRRPQTSCTSASSHKPLSATGTSPPPVVSAEHSRCSRR